MMEDTKQVYAFNLLTGEYEGPKTLDSTDRSPISGSWQIPCNMVEVDPPEIPEATQVPESTTQNPSLAERIAVLEDAVNTLMEGVATNG